jgi:hypothetical protein
MDEDVSRENEVGEGVNSTPPQHDLQKEWLFYKAQQQNQIADNLEFAYKDEAESAPIIEALTFWKFFLENVLKNCEYSKRNWRARIESLRDFVHHGNPLVGVIAMLESMPTSVWRKILWKYNIDFNSWESFLRRITSEQSLAIKNNYEDICANQIPQTFSKFDIWRRKITIEKLFAEGYVYDERYASKGAMSYNLLGLDFGFNAYPNGIKDDKKILDVNPARFLSIKNHADDFVVNTEDGKYWWMYKSARSNYVWHPNRNVTLRTHICPGFWYTLFIHFWFWVVSPIAFVALKAVCAKYPVAEMPWPVVIALGIPAFLTPLWLICAAIIKIFDNPVFKKVKSFLDKFESVFAGALLLVVATLVIILVISVVLVIYDFFFPGFGLLWTILIIATIACYLGHKLVYKAKEKAIPKISQTPFYIRWPLTAMSVALFVKFVFTCHEGILQVFIWLAHLAVAIFAFLLSYWFMSILWIMPFVLLGLYARSFRLEKDKQMKVVDLIEKISIYAAAFSGALSVVILVAVSFFASGKVLLDYGIFSTALLLSLIIEIYVIYNFDPRLENVEKINNDDRDDCFRRYFVNNVVPKLLRHNKWFRTLNGADKLLFVKRALSLAANIARHRETAGRELLYVLLPKMTKEILEELEAHSDDIRVHSYDKTRILYVLKKICQGKSFEQAEKKYQKTEKIKGIIWTCLKIIFFPVVTIFIVATKLAEYAKTLYWLYDLYNKRCPFVAERRTLWMDDND